MKSFSEPEFGTANVLEMLVSYTGPTLMLDTIQTPVCESDGGIQVVWDHFYYDLFGGAEPRIEREGTYSYIRSDVKDTYLDFDGTDWWKLDRNWWLTSSGGAIRTNVNKQRITGYASTNTLAEGSVIDFKGNVTTFSQTLDRANKKVTATTNTPQSTIDIVAVSRNGLVQSMTSESISTPTFLYYDGLQRQIAQTSPLGFTTGTLLDSATGWPLAVTNAAGNVTQTAYYSTNEANAGKPKVVTLPNGRKSYFEYASRGQQVHTWGDVPYPEERGYDSTYEDFTQLKTYRAGSGWTGSTWPTATTGTADTSTFKYDAATGLLISKLDAASKGYTNVYDRAHSLFTKAWARGVRMTNTWNTFGEIVAKHYSDGSLGFSLDYYTSQGQPLNVTYDDTGWVMAHTYSDDGDLVKVSYSGGVFDGLALTNGISALYDRQTLELLDIYGASALKHVFGYDTTTGRLNVVSNGVYSANYSYLPNSDLIASATFKNNGTTRLTTTKQWDYGYRLKSILNVTSAGSQSGQAYIYDSLDRRMVASSPDATRWLYNYDDRSQVTSGKRFWEDWTPVAGQQYEFTYDTIGNRSTMKSGGDSGGANLLTTSYTPTSLNQYSAASNPSSVEIIGAATATSTVSVNGSSSGVYRHGEYFQKELAAGNGSGPVVLSVSGIATPEAALRIRDRCWWQEQAKASRTTSMAI